MLRVLKAHGNSPQILKHLPRQGIAEQRHFLLEQASAPYILFLDDDVLMEPWVLALFAEHYPRRKVRLCR